MESCRKDRKTHECIHPIQKHVKSGVNDGRFVFSGSSRTGWCQTAWSKKRSRRFRRVVSCHHTRGRAKKETHQTDACFFLRRHRKTDKLPFSAINTHSRSKMCPPSSSVTTWAMTFSPKPRTSLIIVRFHTHLYQIYRLSDFTYKSEHNKASLTKVLKSEPEQTSLCPMNKSQEHQTLLTSLTTLRLSGTWPMHAHLNLRRCRLCPWYAHNAWRFDPYSQPHVFHEMEN